MSMLSRERLSGEAIGGLFASIYSGSQLKYADLALKLTECSGSTCWSNGCVPRAIFCRVHILEYWRTTGPHMKLHCGLGKTKQPRTI